MALSYTGKPRNGTTGAERTCRRCGTALSAIALGGLCRQCLGRLAFLSETEDAGEGVFGPRRPRFGDYELMEEIARGGMGVVYRARQVSLDRIVAVKMILHGPFSSEEFVQRFQTEARAAAALHHPNIVAIYEVGQHEGQHYFSMEYIEGKNLGELVRERPLAAERAARYVKTMAEAMHYAHQCGVLHRDLKPSNVLLDVFDQPRIMDFGLAKLLTRDSQITMTGQALGSPPHMPPEQAAGKPGSGPQGDVYSLGAILYHLVTGRPPVQGASVAETLLLAQTAEPIRPRRLAPGVPVDLETICLKCLEKESNRRYGSALDLAEDLGRFLAGEPIRARAVGPIERVGLWCRRRPGLAGLAAALSAVVLLGLAGVLWQWRRAEQHAAAESHLRREAEASSRMLQLNLYAADVNLAAEAIEDGDYGLARRTLAALKPGVREADLRGFEWRYLWNICRGDQLAILTGHEWIVTCAAFSPDGKWIASGSADHTVKVWDAGTFRVATTLAAGTGAVWSVTFSPDGKRLVSSGRGGTMVWESGTWKSLACLPGEIAALSPSGEMLAIAEACPMDRHAFAGEVSLWNPETGERLMTLTNTGHALAFSPDGLTLAVAANPSGIDLWDVETGECRQQIPTAHGIWTLAFSPDGKRLATTSAMRTAMVRELSHPEQPHTIGGHSLTVWSATFSPDGTLLATTSSDQTVRLWDAVTLEPRRVLHGHNHEVWCAVFSGDGRRLATGGKDREVMVWAADLSAVPASLPHRNSMRPLFLADGAGLVTPGKGTELSAVWDLGRRAVASEIPGRNAIGLSPDGRQVVRWSGDATGLDRSAPGETNVVHIPLEGVRQRVSGIHRQGFSPDWAVFYVIDFEGRNNFWDAQSGKWLGMIAGPKPPIRASAVSPDNSLFALGASRESVVRLYERATGRETVLAGHRGAVCDLAFSNDGARLASGSLDGTIRLWDPQRGQLVVELPGHMEETSAVAFSPDGQTLASMNLRNSIKFWHVPTGRQVMALPFPDAGDILAFSPDGRYLAATTVTNSVRLFEAPREFER